MSDMFDKWNKEIDGEKLAKETREVAENGGGEYKEVPHGTYIVKLDKAELKSSRNGRPMVTAWFKIVEGDYRGSIIFMNQVIEQPFQLHITNVFLRSLDSGVNVEFDGNYGHYNDVIMDVFETVQRLNLEYKMEYGQTSKGFNTFKVTEVYGD